jgi:leader peptidase (prepilin peptidase)/N-methyltransferase
MMTDIGKREIPSILLIILSAIALIVEFFLNKTAFFYCLYGIIFSAAIFFAIYLISKRGIGFGDMFYLIFYSALYGVFFTVNAFLYSFWLGALVLMIPLLLKKIDRKTRIPFVPFLFSGGFIALAASLLIKLIIK